MKRENEGLVFFNRLTSFLRESMVESVEECVAAFIWTIVSVEVEAGSSACEALDWILGDIVSKRGVCFLIVKEVTRTSF